MNFIAIHIRTNFEQWKNFINPRKCLFWRNFMPTIINDSTVIQSFILRSSRQCFVSWKNIVMSRNPIFFTRFTSNTILTKIHFTTYIFCLFKKETKARKVQHLCESFPYTGVLFSYYPGKNTNLQTCFEWHVYIWF